MYSFAICRATRPLLPVLAAALLSATAHAHIVLDQKSAPAGSYYRGALRVSHGCDGSATVAITVRIPDGVRGAKPMAKPGWTIERQLGKLDKPYQSHGRTVSEDVTAITWRGGPLPDHQYDEFVLQLQLPETPGPIWFKVLQQCETGQTDWSMLPATGTSTRGLKTPAALLDVTVPATAPAVTTPAAAHAHQH